MRQQSIGEAVCRRRQELGISQEKLAEGLCEAATVSRLENGRQTPSRDLVNALLQRLDLPGDRFWAVLTAEEERLEQRREELISLGVRFQSALEPERGRLRRASLEKLSQLEKLIDPKDRLNRQFILRIRVHLGREDGTPYPFQERLERLLEAIRLTVPRFTLERLTAFRYTLDEVKVLNQIARTFAMNGQREKALEIYDKLLGLLRARCPGNTQARGAFCLIAHNYAGELRMCERFQEALDVAKEGRDACVHYGHYEFLGGLTHTMAECFHFLGDDNRSIQLFSQAFQLYRLVDNEKGVSLLQADARAYFGNLQVFVGSLNGLFG